METLAHHLGPDLAHRAELGNLLEEITIAGEEECQVCRHSIDIKPPIDAALHDFYHIGYGEGGFLCGGAPRLAAGVCLHVACAEVGHLRRDELERVDDEPQAGLWREQVQPLADEAVQRVVKRGAQYIAPRYIAVVGDCYIVGHAPVWCQGERAVVNAFDRYSFENRFAVTDGVAWRSIDADELSHPRIVRVVAVGAAHVHGQVITGHAAGRGHSVFQKVLNTLVGLLRQAEAEHRPLSKDDPFRSAIDAAGEGVYAGIADLFFVVDVLDVLRGVNGLDGDAADRCSCFICHIVGS